MMPHDNHVPRCCILAKFVGILVLAASCAPKPYNQNTAVLARTEHGLHFIGDAITKYREKHCELPMKSDGLLSWRVHLLPFLGQMKLYREFHLDEPWNSAHNLRLIPRIPVAYQVPAPPGEASAAGTTCYLAVMANEVFSGAHESHHRGSSVEWNNVTIVVQVGPAAAVPWTKPEEWEYDSDFPLRDLYVHTNGCVYVLMSDGTVWAIPSDGGKQAYDDLFRRDQGKRLQEPFGTRIRFLELNERGAVRNRSEGNVSN